MEVIFNFQSASWRTISNEFPIFNESIFKQVMLLIVGLGNPGLKYKKTRHNVGFRVLDEFRKENKFPRFHLAKKFKAAISENVIEDKKIILVKPQTFMNSSGKTVKALCNFYSDNKSVILRTSEASPKNLSLIVVHDDLNLPLGEIKISQNRGAGGHKGVESIIKELGTQNFTRLRIGIAKKFDVNISSRSRRNVNKPSTLKDFVLQKFTKDQEKIIKQAIKKASQALLVAIIQNSDTNYE